MSRDCFCAKKRKINLIKTLTRRALMVCSQEFLDSEISFITRTLCDNGYPPSVVNSVIHDKIADFRKIKPVIMAKFI